MSPVPGMSGADDEFWRCFDQVDQLRARHTARREHAFRELGSAPEERFESAWSAYCASVQELESAVRTLEGLVLRKSLE